LNEEYEKDFHPRTTPTNRDFNDAFKKVDGTDCTSPPPEEIRRAEFSLKNLVHRTADPVQTATTSS
jgi:hypothetical protein